ncbi:DNA repair protein RecO (recombination protein O) [Pullulanibacillus pueri]|uniref:DNA repair protein RecO n=1 Tax=Pullulanibacillus pueri TaxID=1437324 RepID=A0A8J2ZXB9_9BACL|nr:DNA repair protein RecO [Pullulanibacillus pueri]MBM7683036.1 DNA repair protein RecO (recombination protein O) [Pullulanibacillus pueri]GGH84998.1 DNA repair protein RecO [Pullulanibacillus pueri]
MLNKSEGIVIHTTDYGETNRIVTLYTKEYGKIGVMARGAKKPRSKLSAGTQFLTYGHYLFNKGRGLGTLHQADPLDAFRYIKADIVPMAYASYIVDVIHKLSEKDTNNPFLYDWVFQILKAMDGGQDPQVLTFIYEIKLLPLLGIEAEVDCCVHCGRPDSLSGFSVEQGGVLCQNCIINDPRAIPLTSIAVKLLRMFKHIDFHRIGKIELKKETRAQIKSVINAYYDAYSGLNLKTKRFIEQIENL